MANHVRPIVLTVDDRAELERLHRASSTPAGLSRRVRAVLLMVQGLSGVEVAERVGSAEKLERVLTADPGMGVIRHADAGYPEAIATARERSVHVPHLAASVDEDTRG
mgnify:CR=1 FL=1